MWQVPTNHNEKLKMLMSPNYVDCIIENKVRMLNKWTGNKSTVGFE